MLIRYTPGRRGPVETLRRGVRQCCYLPVRVRMRLDSEYPWINHGAVKWLAARLASDMIGYEYGGGRSTLFYAARIKHLTSLEHVGKWRKRVEAMLAERGLENVSHVFLPPGAACGQTPPARPDIWRRLGRVPAKPEFAAYFDHILERPDHSLDFVSVDGRARVECALNSFAKIRPGGFLLLDNSEWEKYRPVFDAVPDWTRLDYENGVWRTSILLKPAS